MATTGGRLQLNETESLPLTVQADGTLAGNFTVTKQGFYSIELDGPHGEKVTASPQYTIDVLTDQEPTVSFAKPGRDTTATPVEEVFAEVRADDDFGVKQVQMFYSVNGGAEKTINLFGGAKTLPEVTASHTIYLEELGLKPGDFVSYYAKAIGQRRGGGLEDNDERHLLRADPSVPQGLQARRSRPAAAAVVAADAAASSDQVGPALARSSRRSSRRRSTSSAIEAKKLKKDKFKENATLIKLAQARLREQVEELSGKMNSRLDVVDPALKTIADALPKAVVEMKAAEGELSRSEVKEALQPEGRALKLLQDAEQQYEVQVQTQRGGGGGGGGGGQQQMAQDLADLFELELDKLANQYELQQRAEHADRPIRRSTSSSTS